MCNQRSCIINEAMVSVTFVKRREEYAFMLVSIANVKLIVSRVHFFSSCLWKVYPIQVSNLESACVHDLHDKCWSVSCFTPLSAAFRRKSNIFHLLLPEDFFFSHTVVIIQQGITYILLMHRLDKFIVLSMAAFFFIDYSS